jgi:hypothetical protein
VVGPEWSVDCEYNRYGTGAKVIDDLISIVGTSTPTYETKARTVYPDIIIHRRGPAGPNLLVIEAKKDATLSERADDWWKLKMIKEEYSYVFAAFVNFLTEGGEIEVEILE